MPNCAWASSWALQHSKTNPAWYHLGFERMSMPVSATAGGSSVFLVGERTYVYARQSYVVHYRILFAVFG